MPGIANLPILHRIRPLQRIPLLRATIPLTGTIAWFVWLFVHIASLLGPRNKLTVMVGLIARYGAHLWRTPVPIVGDVPASRPHRVARTPRTGSAPGASADA